jgi:hypothetical protein
MNPYSYAEQMDTTETATCRFCRSPITRVVPSPFAKLARGAKPTDWTGADGRSFCPAGDSTLVKHEPEHQVSL